MDSDDELNSVISSEDIGGDGDSSVGDFGAGGSSCLVYEPRCDVLTRLQKILMSTLRSCRMKMSLGRRIRI